MKTEYTKIVIVGAGPAGATASAFLCREQIPHILIDKAVFPRDKVCGDALSGKVMPVFKKLNPELTLSMQSDTDNFTGSYGIKFAAPNGKFIDIPFGTNPSGGQPPPGFISKRKYFDNFLLQQVDPAIADIRQGDELTNISRKGKKLLLQIKNATGNYELVADLVIAGDGERSLVSKNIACHSKQDDHFCGGVRGYYKNVTGMHPSNYIELHFIKELLPGYFWIFPLPGGYANVGAGMLSSSIKRKKVNLREAMLRAIRENKTISHRFKDATLEGKIEGWGLPLGSVKRSISGENFILTGDAASMIDPFSGEGISNAMYCGMRAAEVASKAVSEQNYSASFLKSYDELVYKRLWNELQLSHKMQKLCNYPWIFNLVINKASKNATLRETISCMFDDIDLRSRFRDPAFYLKLLFNH